MLQFGVIEGFLFCDLEGRRSHFCNWLLPVSLPCNSQFSCVRGTNNKISSYHRLHQPCPKPWNFILFWAYKIKNFSWVAILLFLVFLASYWTHYWCDLFHHSMTMPCLPSVEMVSRLGFGENMTKKEGKKQNKTPSFSQICLLIYLTSSGIRKPFFTFSFFLSLSFLT